LLPSSLSAVVIEQVMKDIILWPLRIDAPNLVVLDCLEWLQADLGTHANQGLNVKHVPPRKFVFPEFKSSLTGLLLSVHILFQ